MVDSAQGGAKAFAIANREKEEAVKREWAAVLAVMVARDAGRYSPCLQRFSANAPRAWRLQA
ncbi:hypothetical protein A2G96_25090 [Cupriavidus nantongensis]|uniref:Uncharacterized protein n=1 Tax=Cupriavidus nantongensis TaxID=1796606 RepID=A0A142JSM6_9BURK|nr:hypothetical protein A2G96_25090 [Cupriavidus nantongensis]